MAIKGKSRRRSRAKGVHTPPKPAVTPRTIPTLARHDVRHAIAVVLGLAVVLGGFRVWVNTSRSDSLTAYLTALSVAETPYTQHLADGDTQLDTKIRAFIEAKVNVVEFKKLTEQWETDLEQARKNVVALRPPGPLRPAEAWLAAGLDGIRGAVRLFNVAAQQRSFADLPAQAKLQPKLEEQVQVVILHANEALTRGRESLQKGIDLIDSYLRSWHIPRPETPGGAPMQLSS